MTKEDFTKPEGTEEEPSVKFVGVVQTYNEEKCYGMITCSEGTQLWERDIYAYKDVLESCGAGVGDTVCFGVHVNAKGMPQASLPMYKLGDDGMPEGVPDGSFIVFVEEEAAKDPSFLENLKTQIESKSQDKNQKRGKGDKGGKGGKGGKAGKGGGGWGGGWGHSGGDVPPAQALKNGWGGNGGWGGSWDQPSMHAPPAAWAAPKGGKGAKGKGKWGAPATTLRVGGIPMDIPRREVAHIFRQYAGFTDLRLNPKGGHTLCFVDFETPEQADFVAEALNGYIWDLEGSPNQSPISVSQANSTVRKGKGSAPY